MLKPYYLITVEDRATRESVGLPYEFETYGEAEDFIAKLSPERAATVLGLSSPSNVYFHIAAASESVNFLSVIDDSWSRPTGHEVAEAMLAALVVLGVCGFVLAVWGLLETIL